MTAWCYCADSGDGAVVMCDPHKYAAEQVAQARREEKRNWEGLQWCLDEIAAFLSTAECCHGHSDPKATPPMMFPEWIMCVMNKKVEQARVEDSRYKKFWEAFWEVLLDQDFAYVDMDCETLVTEIAVALGLVEAVPYDPAKHGENVTGDPEPGDTVYVLAAAIRARRDKNE